MYSLIRHQFFQFLRKVGQTSDGRSVAAKTLDGLLYSPARSFIRPESLSSLPYSDLARTVASIPTSHRSDIVFITGRFRSGSTLLWNVFRQLDQCTAYYEPFNERRWFDPTARGEGTDGTHRGVSDYWREYNGLGELGQYFSDEWPNTKLFMDSQCWRPAMKRYIEILVEKANGRPILQFNRIDFRLPWISHYFPNAKIVHLFRHPRDEWFSCLFHDRCKHRDCSLQEFFEFEGFYLQAWSRDLQHHFPFLSVEAIHHPYHLFYFLWRLSYMFGMEYAHCSVAYEHLVESSRRTLTELFRVLEIQHYDLDELTSFIDPRQSGRWKNYADEEWFCEQEAQCERILADYLGTSCSKPKPVLL